MTKILLVMIGGSLGAISRYGMTLLAARLFGSRFPWGTLAVNLAGCFLIGLAFSLADRGSHVMNPSARLFFMTGFLGALTTFSTFGLETVNSLRLESALIALANVLSNNIIGLALVFLGMWFGKIR
ncbi:MAG: fluoride efflux transporter CrcB [Desulfatirhabdiaceae bacterium]